MPRKGASPSSAEAAASGRMDRIGVERKPPTETQPLPRAHLVLDAPSAAARDPST